MAVCATLRITRSTVSHELAPLKVLSFDSGATRSIVVWAPLVSSGTCVYRVVVFCIFRVVYVWVRHKASYHAAEERNEFFLLNELPAAREKELVRWPVAVIDTVKQ